MALMTKNDRFARVLGDLVNLRNAAPAGSNERLQWEVAIAAAEAAQAFGEGHLAAGLAKARAAASATAGH